MSTRPSGLATAVALADGEAHHVTWSDSPSARDFTSTLIPAPPGRAFARAVGLSDTRLVVSRTYTGMDVDGDLQFCCSADGVGFSECHVYDTPTPAFRQIVAWADDVFLALDVEGELHRIDVTPR
jgi:hypothetical protein